MFILGDPGAASRDDGIFMGESLQQERESPWALTLRVRFFGKIQIRILVSKNGFCVSLPISENGLITD